MKFIANNSACVGFSTIVGLMAALMLPSTIIQYSLETAAQVSLRACNLLGQEVATILNRDLPEGTHRINWEAKDNSGMPLTTGIYFARLEAGSREDIRKLILLK